MKKSRKGIVWAAAVCSLAAVVGLAACSPAGDEGGESGDDAQGDAATQVEKPAADEYGVITAASWQEAYPDQYASYVANESNSPDSGKHNYLELYPALNTMYKGYAFALAYDEASSHVYSLESVTSSPRTVQKEQLANCLTCKTPQFTAQVNAEGDSVYTGKFNDVKDLYTESISCYNCHENDPETLTLTHQYFVNALGDVAGDDSQVPMDAQVCGQCHNEYYFNPETKATTNPYTGLDEMTPEAIYAYFNELGYKDWEHADTLAPMIKVQHPEFETIYGGEQTNMAKLGYSCADCHMGVVEGENGEYTSHNWVSPLENEALLESCNSCHGDLAADVAEWQADEDVRVNAISLKIEQLTQGIAAAYADEIAAIKAAKEKGETQAASAELAELQQLQREAQFYWDFVMVENSEGAHNPQLTTATLDKAEAAVDKGLALL